MKRLELLLIISISILTGVILDIELINNIFLKESNEILITNGVTEVAREIRMNLWPIHLFAGIIISVLGFIYLKINDAKLWVRVVSGIMISTGAYLFFLPNPVILIMHIVTSIFILSIIFYMCEKKALTSSVIIISMVLFGFISSYYILDLEILMENLSRVIIMNNLNVPPVAILLISEQIKSALDVFLLNVMYGVVFVGIFQAGLLVKNLIKK